MIVLHCIGKVKMYGEETEYFPQALINPVATGCELLFSVPKPGIWSIKRRGKTVKL